MNNIPIKSEFSLTDEEKEMLREKNTDELEKRRDRALSKGKISEQELANQFIVDLYYRIGMEDFWIYRDVNAHSDITLEQSQYAMSDIARYLINRAEHSAKIDCRTLYKT